MPLLDDPAHKGLIAFLRTLAERFPTPDAILLISAHWEAPVPTLNAMAAPPLLFDYYGFPAETYRITYPAPGQPGLAAHIADLLKAGGIDCELEDNRGYDHGVFVPMKLLYPRADVPIVQLSLIKGLDAQRHIELGRCLAGLREQNIAIIGSGMSFHNLQAVFAGEQPQYRAASDQFDAWLRDTLCNPAYTAADRSAAMSNWLAAPHARFCHPRAEHLLPVHVCYGAASKAGEVLFNEVLMGHKVSGIGWF
jgi:aromatic ring-opening dioxygenase catalytic subunit (LigB family)